MQFRLTYRGRLRSGNSKDVTHIQEVRRQFHRQLSLLWEQPPLSEHRDWLATKPFHAEDKPLPRKVGAFTFAPLICAELSLHAELDILFLRPAPPGELLRHGGDLDNRIKTLIDCLRIPTDAEVPPQDVPGPEEEPFFCLMSDDKLVSAFSVTSDRLLVRGAEELETEIVVTVRTRNTVTTWGNVSLVG